MLFYFCHKELKIMIKRRTAILLFILISSFSVFAQLNKIDSMKYAIESAIITYKISGTTNGTEIIYFDHWGERETKFIQSITETTFYSVKTKRSDTLLNIFDGKTFYSIDLKNKTGLKTEKLELVKKIRPQNSTYTSAKLKNIGAKLIGEELILDKTCQIWKTHSEKIWLWNGIVLKTHSKQTGKKIIKETIKMETNINIDDKIFTIPEGIKLKVL